MARTKSLFSLRKSPVQQRSAATVDTLLDATAQVLEADEEGGSTNRIAERAGFSIGTLYQYFPNRESILLALAEREQLRVAALVRAALKDLDPHQPEPAVRAALRAVLGAFEGRQRVRRQIILRLAVQAPELLRRQGALIDLTMGEVLALIEARAPGRMRPLDPTARFVLTRAIMGPIRGAVLEGAPSLRDPRLEDELVRLCLSIVLGSGDGQSGMPS
jgi:AcrR family transcriptional regulator